MFSFPSEEIESVKASGQNKYDGEKYMIRDHYKTQVLEAVVELQAACEHCVEPGRTR